MVVNMLLFGNYIWKTFKIKMSHQVALPTSTNASTSKINPKSTTTWSVMDNKGKQSQILTSRKKYWWWKKHTNLESLYKTWGWF